MGSAGSAARFVTDSPKYLLKVKSVNGGVGFYELRDRLIEDCCSVIMDFLTNCTYIVDRMEAARESVVQSGLPPEAMSVPVGNGPKICDLSGKCYRINYRLSFNELNKMLNPMQSTALNNKLNAVASHRISPNNFNFVEQIFTGFAVGRGLSEFGEEFFAFAFRVGRMHQGLLQKAVMLLLSQPNTRDVVKKNILESIGHELIHILDPRRDAQKKSYIVSNSRLYTNHICERASKLHDAFETHLFIIREHLLNGNPSMLISEKKKFQKNKLMYADFFIFNNVSADWPSSAVRRSAFAPDLYKYAIKALDNFFLRADWGKVPVLISRLESRIDSLFNSDVNQYFIHKYEFTMNPGNYIYDLLTGNGVFKLKGSFSGHILGNQDIFNAVYAELYRIFEKR
jgi:hypothetical protein